MPPEALTSILLRLSANRRGEQRTTKEKGSDAKFLNGNACQGLLFGLALYHGQSVLSTHNLAFPRSIRFMWKEKIHIGLNFSSELKEFQI